MAQHKNNSRLEELQEALLNDEGFLKHIVQNFCQKLLEEEMLEHLQADRYQRTEKRGNLQKNTDLTANWE